MLGQMLNIFCVRSLVQLLFINLLPHFILVLDGKTETVPFYREHCPPHMPVEQPFEKLWSLVSV